MTDPLTGEARLVQLGSPRRLRITFDTNLRSAYSAGQWERIEQVAAARPYLRYVAVLDRNTRDDHRRWHGTVLPVGHEWWKSHFPPNGWGCRCTVQQLSAGEVERFGYAISEAPPPDRPRRWTNPRTGETTEVPDGVDPGFGHNIGIAGRRVRQQELALEKVLGAAPELAEPTVAALVESPAFARFFAAPAGEFPIAVLPDAGATALGARSPVAALSAETLRKQWGAHPEIGLDEYRLLPRLARQPRLMVQDGPRSVVVVEREGRLYAAVFKATRSGAGLFLASFHRVAEGFLGQLRRRRGARVLADRTGGAEPPE